MMQHVIPSQNGRMAVGGQYSATEVWPSDSTQQ